MPDKLAKWLRRLHDGTISGDDIVERLGIPGNTRAVEPLLLALKDRPNESLAVALGAIGDPRAVGPLIVALKNKTIPSVWPAAANALASLVPDFSKGTVAKVLAPGFIATLTNEDQNVREAAAKVLAVLGDPGATEPLIACLFSAVCEDSYLVCWAAEHALERINPFWLRSPAVIASLPDLIAALRNENEGVRLKAARYLARISDPRAVEALIVALADASKHVRNAAVMALRDPRHAPDLIAVLTRRRPARQMWFDKHYFLRSLTRRAFGYLGPHTTSSAIRVAAAALLGEIGGSPAVSALVDTLKDGDAQVRCAAVSALVVLGDSAAVEPLISTLTDAAKDVREEAAVALGRLGDVRAVEPLVATLGSEDRILRTKAAVALGGLGDVRAVEPMIAALQADRIEAPHGADALQALGALGDSRVVEALVAWSVSSIEHGFGRIDDAEGMLRRIGGNAIEPLIRAACKMSDRGFCIFHITGIDSDGTYTAFFLPKLLDKIDPGWFMSDAAITQVPNLIASVKSDDEDVRWAAVYFLGRIADARAVEPLISRLSDVVGVIRWHAAEALGSLGDARAVEPLTAALEDQVQRVREEAALALRRLRGTAAIGGPA